MSSIIWMSAKWLRHISQRKNNIPNRSGEGNREKEK